MLTVKKRIIAFSILLLIVLPVVLSVGFYIKKQLVQHQRVQRFKTELLQTFTLKAENVNWIEFGKEILVNGKLFDVKDFKTSGANMVFTGFFDEKEEKLVHQIAKLAKQKNQSQNPLGRPAIKFLFFSVYFCHVELSIDGGNWQWVSHQYQPFFEIIPDAHIHPPLHPPC